MDFTKQELLDLFGLEVQIVDGVVSQYGHCEDGKPIRCEWLAIRSHDKIGTIHHRTGDSLARGGIVWGDPNGGRWTPIRVPTSYFEAGVRQWRTAQGYAPTHCENDKAIFVEEQFDWDEDGGFNPDLVWYAEDKPDALGYWRCPKPGERNLRVRFSFGEGTWRWWCKRHNISIWSIYTDCMGANEVRANQDGTYTFDAFRAFEEEDIRKLKAEINARA